MTGRPGRAQHRWTDAERARLAEVAPGRTHAEIRAIMTEEFGDHFGGKRITGALKRYGIKTGLTGRFEKGCAGGFKSEEHRARFMEAGKATRYRKGNMPHNATQPIGAERVDSKDGYVWVKVAERKTDPRSAHDNWKPKHHLVYERAHGHIPQGCNVVFADHDIRNFDPENLVAVPRRIWSIISRKGIPYWDADSLRTAMAVAELDSARRAVELRPRECSRCGATFRARYPHQRTCDACLGHGSIDERKGGA